MFQAGGDILATDRTSGPSAHGSWLAIVRPIPHRLEHRPNSGHFEINGVTIGTGAL